MNYRKFFARKAEEVARDLLGRTLVRNTERGGYIGGRITETAAYEDGKETEQMKGMRYAPGTIFLMPFRGHLFLNIATDRKNCPSCVAIREVAFPDKVVRGPGAVSNHLGLTRNLDGILLGNELEILGEQPEDLKIRKTREGPNYCLGYFSVK